MPPGRSLPLAAGENGAADEAVVLLSMPAGSQVPAGGDAGTQQPQRVLLRSQTFSLDGGSEGGATSAGSGMSSAHLVLRPEPPAAQRGASRLWGGSGGASSGASGTAGLECRLAARIAVQQFAVAGGDSVAEAASVTITAGCYVSNLSDLPLAMLLEGAAAGASLIAPPAAGEPPALPAPQSSAASLANGGNAARPGALLAPAATVPLMQLWQAGQGGKAGRHRRQSSWSSTGDMLRQLSGGLLPASQPAPSAGGGGGGSPGLRFALASAAPSTADTDAPTPRPELQQAADGAAAAAAPLGAWSAALLPYAAAGRQRLYLQQPAPEGSGGGSTTVMLTHRVLLAGGAFHLVLFRCAPAPALVAACATASGWELLIESAALAAATHPDLRVLAAPPPQGPPAAVRGAKRHGGCCRRGAVPARRGRRRLLHLRGCAACRAAGAWSWPPPLPPCPALPCL